MSREYTAVPHEYLEEMDCLSDAEFGRLIRALLAYSMTGEEQTLSGGEKAHWKRVRNRENRYQEGFGNQEKAKTDRAKNAANARWSNAKNANACTSIPSNAKNANTNTESDSKAESDSDSKGDIGADRADKPHTRHRFKPPSVDDVRAYCLEQGYSSVDPQRFVDYYTANGWKVGKNPMKDWKAAVRGWESREKENRRDAGKTERQLDTDEQAAIRRMMAEEVI